MTTHAAQAPVAADPNLLVSIQMTEEVTYEKTWTLGELAETLGLTVDECAARLSDRTGWSESYGPAGEDNPAILDVLDSDDCRAYTGDDRFWTVHISNYTPAVGS